MSESSVFDTRLLLTGWKGAVRCLLHGERRGQTGCQAFGWKV